MGHMHSFTRLVDLHIYISQVPSAQLCSRAPQGFQHPGPTHPCSHKDIPHRKSSIHLKLPLTAVEEAVAVPQPEAWPVVLTVTWADATCARKAAMGPFPVSGAAQGSAAAGPGG